MEQTRSPHPVDRLIRELIESGREATQSEIRRILWHIAAAPFDPGFVRVPARRRGLEYGGVTLGAREQSLTWHLVKRVIVEGQWAPNTTPEQYLADLRYTAGDALARLLIYRRGDDYAAVIAATGHVIPIERCGPEWLADLIVVYSATRGIIRTGYQFSALRQLNLPTEVRWLG